MGMWIYLLTVFIWFVCLYIVRPAPASLKSKIPSRISSLKEIKATVVLGLVLITVFFVISLGNMDQANEAWMVLLGALNIYASVWWPVTALTNIFLHFNYFHLIANLSALGLASLYERRVGYRRFLTVFIVGGFFSSFSVFFQSEPTISIGASAGILALAAAYFLDQPRRNFSDLIGALFLLAIFYVYLEFSSISEQNLASDLNVDRYGHLLGLVVGVIYCLLFQNSYKQVPEKK